jgi:hypothetical protein
MASDDELPYNSDMSKMKDFKIKGLLRQFKKDCIKVHRFRIPKEDFKPLWAFHTWLIPFYSSVFWLLMLSVYCGFVFQSWTPALVIGIPILVLIGLSCITENVSLVRKNPDTWQTVQGPSGKYSYKLVGTSISGKFNGHGFAAGTAYTLVSYKDGDNIVELGNGTANAHGDLKIMNGRINIGAAQKWTGDYLGQQIGYKIWLVPTRDITAGKLTWHPNGFLFETGLITALDTNNKDTRSE